MIRDSFPNPLNVMGLRKVEHLPPHFYTVNFDVGTNSKRITDWIWENLEGRFYFGDVYSLVDGTGHGYLQKCAAFEIHSEASYFALVLVDLNSYQ